MADRREPLRPDGAPAAGPAGPVLDVRNLHKSFVLHAIDGRRIEALRGIDLQLHAGEHVALVGSSGAGKSTLLKSIYRTYLPDRGEVWLRGTATNALDTDAVDVDTDAIDLGTGAVDLVALDDRSLTSLRVRRLGYVSQFLRSEPRRGVLDAVARSGVRRGLDPATAVQAARRILLRLGIGEQLWQTFPTLLSGGEKQRVNLAAGIINPPPVLLLDEPVSALDPANRDAVLALIAELTEQGTSVLAVFHDLDAIERLAHRVIRLDAGRVAAVGTPADILPELTASIGATR